MKFKLERANNFNSVVDSALDLYKVPRTGWLMRGVKEDEAETVGEHTEAMTTLFDRVIDKIDPENKLDRNRMLKMIQVHDWAEGNSDVGDQVVISEDESVEHKLKKQKESDELSAMKKIC